MLLPYCMNSYRMNKSSMLLGVIVLFIATFTTGASSQEQDKIQFGALVPLSGDLAIMGQTAMKTFEIAETNFEGLFGDIDIEIIVEDTQTNPDVAFEKIQELYERGIRVIVGPFASSCVEKIKTFADEHQILIVSPTSTSMSLAQDDWIFRLSPNEAYKADAISAYLQYRGLDSVVLLYRDDTYGNEYVETFKPLWSETGGRFVGEVSYSPEQTDFTETVGELNRIVQAQVDAGDGAKTAVLAISYEEIGSIVKYAAQENALSQVHWVENENAAHIDVFLNDEEVQDFAERTNFSFASIAIKEGYHPVYPHTPKCENLLTQIYRNTDEPLQEDIVFYTYDACQIASFVSITVDFLDPKETFKELSEILLGVSDFLNVDENGDRAYGVIAFNQFTKTGDEARWSLAGSYRKPTDLINFYEPFEYKEYAPLPMDHSIRIGALLSLTGDNATMGQEIEKTLATAERDLNDYLKREFSENSSVEILTADTGSNPQTALEKMQELHAQGVELFVGPLTSDELNAVASYVNENGLTVISPSSTSLDLALDDNIFRFALDNGKLAKALAEYYIDNGVEFVQTVYRNDSYGADFQVAFQTKFEERGGVCGNAVAYDPNTTDFNSSVDELTDGIASAMGTYGSNHSSVLVIALDEAAELFKSIPNESILREVNWIGGDGLAGNAQITEDEIVYQFALDTNFTAFSPGNVSYNIIGLFERAWRNLLRDSIGSKPTAYSFMAYDAAWYMTMLSVKEAYEAEGFDRKEGLVDLVNQTKGPFQYYRFNEAGDTQYGYTDFYALLDSEGEARWSIFAKYSYQFDGEELFYIGDRPGTNVGEWPVY